MKVTNYQIEMLSVGAADAFIIYFIDENQKGHLVLVDAGNYGDGQLIIDHIRKYYSNPIIDLAIVTHPDDDHYGGFVKMLEKLRDKERDDIKINKFWVNASGNNHVDKSDVKGNAKQLTINDRANSVYDLNDENLIDLIDDVLGEKTREEKFKLHLVPSDSDFPCFRIIGPTEKYYESLIPDFRNDELNFLYEDDVDYIPDCDIPEGECLSSYLDDAYDDPSAHNQSSIIFLFEPENGKKYLFMGDAGKNTQNLAKERLITRLKQNIDWEYLETIKPSPQEYLLAKSIGTNLTALKKIKIDALIKHSNWLTEVQVRLYLPYLIQNK